MTWFDKLLSRFRWRWVGTVEGATFILDKDGTRKPGSNYSCYWNLLERGDGKRRHKLIGYVGGSQASFVAQAQVEAWAKGGPLPQLYSQPTPERPKPQLIVFPGGKGGAA